MHFLLQSNVSTPEAQAPYLAALEAAALTRPKLTWSQVKLIPFAGRIDPADERDYGPLVFPFGSTTMQMASQHYGWTPGVVYDPATFRFDAWRDGWGAANLINGEAEITTFGAVRAATTIFIRPVEDTKAFSGGLIEPDRFADWQRRTEELARLGAGSTLTPSTRVIVAAPKTIVTEWRCFVVGGRIVTASQYGRMGLKVVDATVPERVFAYAQAMGDLWQPARCFVLDIGETPNGLGIVEVNTLNTSGLYACDAAAIIMAVEDLYQP